MGVAQSTNATEILNQSIIDVIVANINKCSAAASQQMDVHFGGVGIWTKVEQELSLSLECIQKVKITNDIITEIANQIQQDASASSVALLPSYSGSSNLNKLVNYLQTKITTETIQECTAVAEQKLRATFTGIQIGSEARQTQDVMTKCMQDILNKNKVTQEIVSEVEQTAESEVSSPLDFLSNIYVIIIIIAVIIGVIIIAYLFMGRGGGGGGPTIILTKQGITETPSTPETVK